MNAKAPSTSHQASGSSPVGTWMRTIVIMIWVAAATFAVGVFVIVLAALSRPSHTLHRVAGAWARSILSVSRIRVTVSGLERVRPERPYVFMSNHQSNFDIPVLLGYLPVQFRWLAKAELFKIPVFGRAMRGAGYISIDRADRPSAFESLRKAAEIIRGGVSILVFPEGTRSLDGRLKPFKKGGFVLAIEAGVPIVPLAILGTYSIMPKGSLLIRPRDVRLCLGEPIATTAYTPRTKDALMEQVRQAITSAAGGATA